MTAGPGQGKLAPTTLYGLVAKNFNGQFTAWTSRGDNSSAENLPVTKHGLFSLPRVTKIQNKIVAAAARFNRNVQPGRVNRGHIARQQKQIEALTAGFQKVSAQLELGKPASQTVLNNQ